MSQAAFVLRIAPSGIDKVDEAISTNQLIIGWADAEGLLNLNLTWEQFREIIRTQYHADEANLRRAGAAAGHMWRFIRDMKPGDLIVVPHWANFLVAEVTGPAIYDVSKVADDSAYRRPVRWLTNKNGITRRLARSALQSRMKTQGSSADATDLIPHIRECLQLVAEERAPTFATDLQARLIRETLDELRSGRINDLEFEKLIEVTLRNLGADNVQIVPRSKDKGADLIASGLPAPSSSAWPFRRSIGDRTRPLAEQLCSNL